MRSEASSHEMARKLLVHSTLDHVFSAQYDVSRLPQLISQVGMQYIGCEFVSMWRYEPSEHILYNLVARSNLSSGYGRQQDLPTGSARLPVERGPGKGIMMNLAAEVLEGARFEDMPPTAYIVNERAADPRATPKQIYDDASNIHSTMYAPMAFNGFKGMMVALNHERHAFDRADWEILKILASKAAIVVDNIEQRNAAEQTARLALLGRAVDIVRHELKAPLTAIKGAAAIVLRQLPRLQGSEEDLEMVADMARMIASEVNRNVRLLHDIQNYCNPKLELTITPGRLDDFLRAHVEEIRAAAGERKPELVLELLDPLTVAFSPDHILEVMRNFFRNSAETGTSRVTVRAQRVGEVARLEVSDEGGGIEEAALSTLFRPYESTRTREGGTGLGLFISRRIIEEGHGGRLSAHNVYDGDVRKGLMLQVEMPCAVSAPTPT